MNNKLRRIIPICVAALLLAGCGGYNKLLKSNDHEQKYRTALQLFEQRKYQKTLYLLQEVQNHFYGSEKMDSIAYYTGASYFMMGDYDMSGTLFNQFRDSYAGGASPFLERAEYMYAMGFYYASGPANRDQTSTNRAIMAIDEYLMRYPASENVEQMRWCLEDLTYRLHDKAYINAKVYYTTGRYKSAVVALRNALAKYPASKHREEMLYLVAKSSYLLASNSVDRLMRDRYANMMDDYYTFISEYPESDYLRELNRMQSEARAYLAQFSDGNDTAAAVEEVVEEEETITLTE